MRTLTASVMSAAAIGALLLVPALSQAAPAPTPGTAAIPQGRGYDQAEKFIGRPAVPNPVTLPKVSINPYMSPNGTSNIHNDTWMTDSYPGNGPLGRNTQVTSVNALGECASITFDSRGRLVAVCINPKGSFLTMMHPDSLRIVAREKLPAGPETDSSGDYTEVAGAYFYLDNLNRAVVATANHQLTYYAYSTTPGDRGFKVVKEIDITSAMDTTDSIQSALPDFSGNVWFATKSGVVGNVNPKTEVVKWINLPGETISNSFAMDKDGGVYIVSTAALYRFDAGSDGTPVTTWRAVYDNTGETKPSQKSAGSGTTPTVMSGGRVAIVDNANPENVVVYRTSPNAGNRKICQAPVFSKDASATENSLIAIGDSLIAENNFGYSVIADTTKGKTTTPGMARVDVTAAGECVNVWTNNKVIAPSVVPKFSAKTGLIYTYTKPAGPGTIDRWYWTALDYRTGRIVYSVLTGTGVFFNNSYASLYLSPSGVGYAGVIGGVVRVEG